MFVLRGEEGAELLFSPGPASAPDMAAREQRQHYKWIWQAARSHFDWQLKQGEDMADIKNNFIFSASVSPCVHCPLVSGTGKDGEKCECGS